MTEKTEALWLAEFYEALAEEPPKSPDNSGIRATAAKLRRLAAVEAQRDALLEALRDLMARLDPYDYPDEQNFARAAIKAMEGEKT